MADDDRPGVTKALLGWIAVGSALVGLAAGARSLYVDWQKGAAVAPTAGDDDYTRTVTDKVTSALLSGDAARQQRAVTLVMTLPEGPTRERLLEALASRGTESNVRDSARQASGGQKAVAGDAPAVAAPVVGPVIAKADVFWCETGGTAAERAAGAVVDRFSTQGLVGSARARQLPAATNARPDYQIAANIVRFDPGEQPAAAALAKAASIASGLAFSPAPALPGTPSVNYLSVFVCGETG